MRLLTCLSPYFFCYSKNWAICIWLNFMRTHIDLKICHFLLSVVSITEGPKNKIMRKSGIHSSVPCWDSTLEQFLFYRVSGKNAKSDIFWSHRYSTIHLSKQHFCHKIEAPRNIMFFNFFGHPAKQKLFYSTVPTWDRTMDARFPHNFVFWALSTSQNRT